MEFAELKQEVWRANKRLATAKLAPLTWGNVSGVDRRAGVLAIKPSGVGYEELEPGDIVVVSLATGESADGALRPSSDTPSHLILYAEFPAVGGVVHTHSTFATSWAQACREIPCLGTTHADLCHGPIPQTRHLTSKEIEEAYEANTGRVIVERLRRDDLDPVQTPAVLVPSHGPFSWGRNPAAAVDNAIALEEVAKMAWHASVLNPDIREISQSLLDKHFLRKHGAKAYYGQKNRD